MAFTLSPDAQLVFFTKVFGAAHPVAVQAKALVDAGVKFEVSMYTVKAQAPGKKLPQVSLTYGTTSLMKGTVDQVFMAQNKTLIETWLNDVALKMGILVGSGVPKEVSGDTYTTAVTPVPFVDTPPTKWKLVLTDMPALSKLKTIKAVMGITGKSLLEAKNLVEAGLPVTVAKDEKEVHAWSNSTALTEAGAETMVLPVGSENIPDVLAPKPFTVTGPAFTPSPQPFLTQPVAKVIHLKEAKALGQKVHGTSTGSVYHCIAYTDHVKVAARISKGGSISIRAEWTDSPKADLKKLEESGVQMKPSYASMHFGAEGVPLQRVIGAFLVGTGIKWTAAVMNGSDLVIGE
jgi:ribosomal protein L7/L12